MYPLHYWHFPPADCVHVALVSVCFWTAQPQVILMCACIKRAAITFSVHTQSSPFRQLFQSSGCSGRFYLLIGHVVIDCCTSPVLSDFGEQALCVLAKFPPLALVYHGLLIILIHLIGSISLSSPPVAGVWCAHWRRCPVAAVASSKWMLHTGGGWGVTPYMIVKRFGCIAIHNKRYINASFIHSVEKGERGGELCTANCPVWIWNAHLHGFKKFGDSPAALSHSREERFAWSS